MIIVFLVKSVRSIKTKTFRDRIAAARKITDTDTTPAMRAVGNYRMGTVRVHGLMVRIENPRGSYRRGVSPDGKRWSIKMKNDYGYFTRAHGSDSTPYGVDGDPVDVFLGPHPESELVFIVDQVDQHNIFDEHKVVMGARNEEEARQVYLANYQAGWHCGPITAMTLEHFKAWLKTSDNKKGMVSAQVAATAG